MILRAIKNFTPLSFRIFVKNRLPARLVRVLATPPESNSKKTGDVDKRIEPACPICGTSLPDASSHLDIQCAGCGSLPHHRKLALAVYTHVKEADTQILVIGSDQVLQLICEGFEKVSFASDPATVPAELHSRVDLCIHSQWLQDSRLGPEASLRSLDALLSPKGKQIFTLGPPWKWYQIQWRRNQKAFPAWLQRKGWTEVTVFEPDEVYGTGAADIFQCATKPERSATVIYLPKATQSD